MFLLVRDGLEEDFEESLVSSVGCLDEEQEEYMEGSVGQTEGQTEGFDLNLEGSLCLQR